MSETAWRDVFDAALAKFGTVGLARELGYNNHTLVSRIAKGDVEASSKFKQRLMQRLARINCPYLQQSITPQECTAFSSRSFAAINAPDVPHFRTCKKCQHRQEGGSTC